MAAKTKMEFAVEMTCQSCVNAVTEALKDRTVNLERQQVVIESTAPSNVVKDMLESTGRRAVLQGLGSATGSTHLGAAVAQLQGGPGWERGMGAVQGVVRMVQVAPDTCVVEGTVDGLTPGQHGLFVHENGDLSEGCQSCGEVFEMMGKAGATKKYGDLSRITAGQNGRAEFRFESPTLQVWDIIGRSMVIHDETHNMKDQRTACGIIARSSGLFQNDKKICACDGIVLWDERDHPVAGPNRRKKLLQEPSPSQL